jgi:serine/threonine protein kinase
MLCQLGQGASSIVYKALDIVEMRLVALKIVPVFDRYTCYDCAYIRVVTGDNHRAKRRQMVRELSTLFQVLRTKQKELNGSEPGLHVSLKFDLKSRSKNPPSAIERLESYNAEHETYRIYSQYYIVDFYDAFR